MDLFTIFAEGGDQGKSATELASITGGEVILIGIWLSQVYDTGLHAHKSKPLVRIMRALTAIGIFKETGVQCYAATPLSSTLAGPELRDELKFLFVVSLYIPTLLLM